MKLPIPDDWDGESWRCVQVQWPDSVLMRGMLLGFLSYLTRGRVWDERTGSIKAIQAVGWEIFNRNYPLVTCTDCPECPECPDCPECPGGGSGDGSAGSGACCDLEDEDMGQVVTDVTIENGILYVYFGPCCKRAVANLADVIGDSIGGDLGDDPLNPDNDPNIQHSACGKAWAIVESIFKVLEAANYAISTAQNQPWFWLSLAENYSDMNLNDKWLAVLCADTLATGPIMSPEEAFSQEDQQKAVCKLVAVLGDGPEGVPDGQTYEAVKTALHTGNFLGDGFIMTAVNALGRGNLDRVAKMGATTTDRNCDCPEINPEIVFGDLVWARTVSSITRADGVFTQVGRTNRGLTYEYQFVSSSGGFKALIFNHGFDRAIGAQFTELTIALEPLQPLDELLHSDWNTSGCSNLGENSDVAGSISPSSGATTVKKWDGGRFYVKWTHATPQTAMSWSSGESRNCPSDGSNPGKTYRWKAHIVSINGVDTGVVPNTTWP